MFLQGFFVLSWYLRDITYIYILQYKVQTLVFSADYQYTPMSKPSTSSFYEEEKNSVLKCYLVHTHWQHSDLVEVNGI